MITQAQREGCYEFANNSWYIRWLLPSEDNRKALVDSTAKHLTVRMATVSATEGSEPKQLRREDRSEIKSAIVNDPEVKQFIEVILFALIGWAIQKLLDYLWDNWTYNRQHRSEYGSYD